MKEEEHNNEEDKREKVDFERIKNKIIKGKLLSYIVFFSPYIVY